MRPVITVTWTIQQTQGLHFCMLLLTNQKLDPGVDCSESRPAQTRRATSTAIWPQSCTKLNHRELQSIGKYGKPRI
jgi:hypothetical protein